MDFKVERFNVRCFVLVIYVSHSVFPGYRPAADLCRERQLSELRMLEHQVISNKIDKHVCRVTLFGAYLLHMLYVKAMETEKFGRSTT
jgi:hypothetical protein